MTAPSVSASALRSLVHSVLVPGFDGTTTPDWLKRRLEGGLAGVCWFGQNVEDAEQARRLADELHSAGDGVLVLSDEEGGDVTRLESQRGSSWPGHAALGRLDDPDTTQAIAAALGHQARRAGVDVALSPVVDVNSDPDNPVIGVRSFGATADVVSRHGAAFVRGLQSVGVAACAKHYPGHGATRTDSHVALPYVDDDIATLRARDLAPFAAVVQAGVRCVMTAHVVFSAFDDEPATMSPTLLGLLRAELGFGGVVVSDALDMHAISRRVGRGPGAVRALASGVDLVCIGNPAFPDSYDAEQVLDEVAAAVIAAVQDGTLSRARLEQAATRVADLAAWVGSEQVGEGPGSEPGGELGVEVARRVVETRGEVKVGAHAVVVQVDGPVNVAAGRRPSAVVTELCRRRQDTPVVHISSVDDVAALGLPDRQVVVVLGERRSDQTDAIVAALLAACADAVVVDAGLVDSDHPGDPGSGSVHTYGGGHALAVAAVDLLLGGDTS